MDINIKNETNAGFVDDISYWRMDEYGHILIKFPQETKDLIISILFNASKNAQRYSEEDKYKALLDIMYSDSEAVSITDFALAEIRDIVDRERAKERPYYRERTRKLYDQLCRLGDTTSTYVINSGTSFTGLQSVYETKEE